MGEGSLKKRDRTRDRLLVAAQELVLDRGLPAITINDIAARAEVAPGTFYNYFRTREEVADTIADLLQRAYHRDIDAVTAGLDDPARVFSASLRQTLHWSAPGNRMGRMLFASGVPLARYALGVRQRAARDIQAGVDAGVFRVEDTVALQSMLGGIVIGVLMDLWLGMLPASAIPSITARCLGLLGVSTAKAQRIAAEPLVLRAAPELPLTASGLLEPVEAGITGTAALPPASLTLAAPVSAMAAGTRPRVSRGLRGTSARRAR